MAYDTPYLLPSNLPPPPPYPFSHTLNFQIRIVFNFSRDHCDTQEKLRSKVRHFLGVGEGGASKVFYGSCANGEFNCESTPQTKLNLWLSSPSSQSRYPCSGTYAHRWFVKKAIANLWNKLKRNAFPVNCWALYVAGTQKKEIFVTSQSTTQASLNVIREYIFLLCSPGK